MCNVMFPCRFVFLPSVYIVGGCSMWKFWNCVVPFIEMVGCLAERVTLPFIFMDVACASMFVPSTRMRASLSLSRIISGLITLSFV